MSLSHSSITHVVALSLKVLLHVVQSPFEWFSSHPGPGGIHGVSATSVSFSCLQLPVGKAVRNGTKQSLSKI